MSVTTDRGRLFQTGISVAALTFVAAVPATAQTASADDRVAGAEAPPADLPPATEAPTEGGLAEIVVTAERRTQNLQNVPISATVLNAADISRKGVANIADIQQVAPSVAINTYNRSTFINIRGVGIAQSAPTSSTGVAYYIDGQFVPNEQYIGFSFYDIGSIEVLRGPQGTLTGQNSTGGALYVRTPDPVIGQFSGYVDQLVGNYDQFRTTAAVNVPVSPVMALRVAGVYDLRDSFSDQVGTSRSTPGNVDFYSFRGNLLIEPSDSFGLNLRIEHFNNDTDNNAVQNRALVATSGSFTVSEDAISYLRNRGTRYSGEARIDLSDGVRWRTHVSWQDSFTRDQADGDRTATARPRPPAANVGRVGRTLTTNENLIVETNLLSSGASPLQWVIGGFYLRGDVGVEVLRDNNNTVNFISSTSTVTGEALNTTKAGFGQLNWKLGDMFELIGGARYSADRQRYTRTGVTDVQKSEKVTGRVAANFYPTQGVTLYASATRGYKAGGVNLPTNTAPFTPETNDVLELGFKTTMLDRRLRVNGDVFFSDYKDIQFSSLFNGLPITQNAAKGRSKGAELEVTGQFGDLGFNLGAGWLDAEFAETVCINNTNRPGGNRAACPVGVAATTADDLVPKGTVLPFSPKWTVNAGIQYDIRLGGGATITPRFQWAHLSRQVATPFPDVLTNVPARDVFDARIVFQPTDRYTVEAFATNIFDKTYIASQIQNASSADGGILWGAPRQIGVRARVKLGPV